MRRLERLDKGLTRNQTYVSSIIPRRNKGPASSEGSGAVATPYDGLELGENWFTLPEHHLMFAGATGSRTHPRLMLRKRICQ